jgi:hypothetical protein
MLTGSRRQQTEAGKERIFTANAARVDTNILVYRFDYRLYGTVRIPESWSDEFRGFNLAGAGGRV